MSNQELATTEQAAEEPDVTEVAASEAPAEEPAVDSPVSEEAPEKDVTETEEAAPQNDAEEPAVPADTSEDDTSKSGTIHGLQPGQSLHGTVKNITAFGAFVDIGLPQDGLVHISEVSRKKVDKVDDVVSEGDEVDVWVKKVDTKRGRISLTMVKPISLRLRDIDEEAELEGTITRLESYGAFIDIGSERDGLVHISQITHEYINHPEDTLTVGDTVNVKVLKVNRKKRQVDLSIKALLPPPVKVEEVKEEVFVEAVEETVEEEPVPTAMALAFAALQDEDEDASSKKEDYQKDKRQQKEEMDDIVARTLATAE